MTESRPAIPRPLRRAVKVEAGHRCAIPTCRQTSGLQIHHIVDWAHVRDHSFENLILICAVCHARATSGEIDPAAMKQYKANLGVVGHRYGEMERRLLEKWAREGVRPGLAVVIPGGLELMYAELIRDGIVRMTTSSLSTTTDALGPVRSITLPDGGQQIIGPDVHVIPMQIGLTLTDVGADLVQRMTEALPIEGDEGDA